MEWKNTILTELAFKCWLGVFGTQSGYPKVNKHYNRIGFPKVKKQTNKHSSLQNFQLALERLKDAKFAAASQFSAEEAADPVATKIVNSVLFAYAKLLSSFCPYKEVSSGPLVLNFFNDNFYSWFSNHFPNLALNAKTCKSFKGRAHGWFLTGLKRKQKRETKAGKTD